MTQQPKLLRILHIILHRLRHKFWQTQRLSRKGIALTFLLIGSALVSLTSLGFAKAADFALEHHIHWVTRYPWISWIIMPLGFMLIVWLTRRFAPYTSGSGIPQVLASLSLPYGARKSRLVLLTQTILKIPLTFLGMLIGASIGREGPSVQVGAAVMLAWGNWCKKRNIAFKGLQENDLIAAGAAGGLAAAFNAPLAGVIFAIEELGRSIQLRWERQILIGVLAAGFILVAIDGNNPYFSNIYIHNLPGNILLWVLACGLVCGMAGGLFARFLSKGIIWFLPARPRRWVNKHPIWVAGILGVLVATIGLTTHGMTYGTGYHVAATALQGDLSHPSGIAFYKWWATVLSYWAGLPGGIFTPALTIGAMIGEEIAQLMGVITSSNMLVLLCMAAYLAAATQSPLTASVVVMEMTGSQSALFWLLMASMMASMVSRQFCPKPFYHAMARRFFIRVQEEHNRTQEKQQEQTHQSTTPIDTKLSLTAEAVRDTVVSSVQDNQPNESKEHMKQVSDEQLPEKSSKE